MRRWRQDSHLISLVAWAVLCAVAAGVLFTTGHRSVARSLHWTLVAGGAAFLFIGPVAFLVYAVRARLVWVSVDSERGINVADRYVIPWDGIVRVERKRPALRKKAGPAEMGKGIKLGDVGSGCGGCGDIGGVGGSAGAILVAVVLILLAVVVLYWLIVVVVVPLLIVPLLEVFAPAGDRIRIVGQERTLVLRDLRDADGFVAALRDRVQVVER